MWAAAPKAIAVLFLLQLLQHWQTTQQSLARDLHHWLHLYVPTSSSTEDLASFSPLGFGPESSSVSWSSTAVDWGVKVQLPFNFLDGNRFPSEWEWVMFELLVVGVFGSRGSLASAHLSSFQAARSNLGIGDRIFTMWTLWANICNSTQG